MTDNAETAAAPDKDQPKEEEGGDFFRTAIIAILLAVTIRTFLFEPFNIPSGSMKPTLEIGDYLFVSKFSYGYSKHSFPFSLGPFEGREFAREPQRGDVVVFKLPTNIGIDYIKRIVALPGETVQMRGGRLYINGELVPREPVGLKNVAEGYAPAVTMMEYIETLPGGVMHRIYEESDRGDLDNTGVYRVPEGHYFFMGDNRDNSQDSRVQSLVGPVPFENFVGRAEFLFFSIDTLKASWAKPWGWPAAIRWERIFDGLKPVRPAKGETEEDPA